MKNVFLLALAALALTPAFASAQAINRQATLLRCEGPVVGAQRIEIIRNAPGLFHVVLSGGGVVHGALSFTRPMIEASLEGFRFRTADGQVDIIADRAHGRSYVKLFVNDNSIGFGGNGIAISSSRYMCFVPQSVLQ